MKRKLLFTIALALIALTATIGQATLVCSAPSSMPNAYSTCTVTHPAPASNVIVNYIWKLQKSPNTWTWYSNFGTKSLPLPFVGTYKAYVIVQYVRRYTGQVLMSKISNTLTINCQ